MIKLIFVGILSGIISPLFLSLLQHKWIWKSQKKLEVKYSIFNDAVRALSLYSADALDPKLQSEKASYKGFSRQVEMRPETAELIQRASGMIAAFFSKEAYSSFEKAIREKISIENVPNMEFEEALSTAIICLSKKLGIK